MNVPLGTSGLLQHPLAFCGPQLLPAPTPPFWQLGPAVAVEVEDLEVPTEENALTVVGCSLEVSAVTLRLAVPALEDAGGSVVRLLVPVLVLVPVEERRTVWLGRALVGWCAVVDLSLPESRTVPDGSTSPHPAVTMSAPRKTERVMG